MTTRLNSIRSLIGCLVIVGFLTIAEEPKTPLELAVAAEARGEITAARDLYEKGTRDNPLSAECWAALGEHLRFYVHDYAAAATAFRTALSASKGDAHAEAFAWRGLGEIEAKENRDDAAIDCFKKSLKAEPLADTHRSLCHLYCRQKNYKEAAEQAGAAVRLNPDDAIARLLYAAQLHRAGATELARKEFDAALGASGLKLEDDAPGMIHCCILYNAAGYLSVCGEQEKALKMLRRFFETPNHRHLTREEVENDGDFAALKSSAAFRNLLDKAYSGASNKPTK